MLSIANCWTRGCHSYQWLIFPWKGMIMKIPGRVSPAEKKSSLRKKGVSNSNICLGSNLWTLVTEKSNPDVAVYYSNFNICSLNSHRFPVTKHQPKSGSSFWSGNPSTKMEAKKGEIHGKIPMTGWWFGTWIIFFHIYIYIIYNIYIYCEQ